MASQTVLTAPGPGAEPTATEVLDMEGLDEASLGADGPGLGNGVTIVPEATGTAVTEKEAHAAPRPFVRRAPPPPARPKLPAPASSSASNEPDVGF